MNLNKIKLKIDIRNNPIAQMKMFILILLISYVVSLFHSTDFYYIVLNKPVEVIIFYSFLMLFFYPKEPIIGKIACIIPMLFVHILLWIMIIPPMHTMINPRVTVSTIGKNISFDKYFVNLPKGKPCYFSSLEYKFIMPDSYCNEDLYLPDGGEDLYDVIEKESRYGMYRSTFVCNGDFCIDTKINSKFNWNI